MRPEWLLIPERSSDCAGRYYCSQAAQQAILNLSKNKAKEKVYSLQKTFYSEIMDNSPRKQGTDFHLGRRFLYKINEENYSPF